MHYSKICCVSLLQSFTVLLFGNVGGLAAAEPGLAALQFIRHMLRYRFMEQIAINVIIIIIIIQGRESKKILTKT